jgi:hypothetical protein
MTSTQSITAGWYPDPEGSDRLRYWDGKMWTSDFAGETNDVAVAADSEAGPAPQQVAVGAAITKPRRAAPSVGPQPVVQQHVVVQAGKSAGLAAVLGFLFGPLGMLYSTILGAIVMFFVAVVVGIATFGLGLFVVWPVCAVWAALAASSKNAKLARRVTRTAQQAAAASVSPASASAAAWYADPDGSDRLRYWDGARWTDHYSESRSS